ncbi:MAG: family transcriptional regulator [Frankiales bacterium]|nr:family transcriptional regulator [Frankiales bacterium]
MGALRDHARPLTFGGVQGRHGAAAISGTSTGTSEGTPVRACVAGPVYPGPDRTPLPRAGGRSVDRVDNRTEVREFLTTRRAKITPDQAGVPLYGQRRRVPGLRREEVAQLVGLSTDYYTRLEKGNLRGASDSALDAIARALQLDDAERAHLHDLTRAARAGAREPRRRAQPQQVRPSLQHMLDAMTTAVAFIRNGRLDILAINPLGRAFYTPVLDSPARPANLARYCFLDPSAEDFYPDWADAADTTVALLRTEAGRDAYNRALTDLVGELATRSDAFRTRWAAHDVRLHHTGVKRFRHPIAGDLTVGFNATELPADPGLTLTVYTAEPSSESAEKLTLLASWAVTAEQPRTTSPACLCPIEGAPGNGWPR